ELATEKKPFLQGWATVENATEEDWKDVRLSLVSGRPISFMMDLYTPIYIPRPREELELYASLRPPGFEGAFADEKDKLAVREETRKRSIGQFRAPAKAAAPMEARRGYDGRFIEEEAKGDAGADAAIALAGTGVMSVASAQQAGELFEY